MFSAVYAAYVALHYTDPVSGVTVGGLNGLLNHGSIIPKLNIMSDFSNWMSFIPLLMIPIAVQWWAVCYPGAEPGGGGYSSPEDVVDQKRKECDRSDTAV